MCDAGSCVDDEFIQNKKHMCACCMYFCMESLSALTIFYSQKETEKKNKTNFQLNCVYSAESS